MDEALKQRIRQEGPPLVGLGLLAVLAWPLWRFFPVKCDWCGQWMTNGRWETQHIHRCEPYQRWRNA